MRTSFDFSLIVEVLLYWIYKLYYRPAEKLFNSISTANVKYHKVATYQDLIDGMNAAQSILALSMADKSMDDIEPLVSATKKMCFTSFFFIAIAQSGAQAARLVYFVYIFTQ